ncbi:fes/CIP4 domain-containing protein [Moelleriella libera RCEF 2490]|uniref:Fes/CIP4 domain-containing protein n=1 Tax=Moelleriella libera RCEF 2490 TaxID=1081109 RepID=A0A168F6S5_9HYPO|nr:fes/CIP4 domain-containing protein [Moelleriella libera RCEF 2490]
MADTEGRAYPAMLASLQPDEAAQTFDGRVKRINKVNVEIADWLQERRRIEEQYVNGLRKLAQGNKGPASQSELGVLQAPWAQIVKAVERIAQSHEIFCQALNEQVERPLRAFQQDAQVANLSNVSSNLNSLAKALQDAQSQSDKLNKKGKSNENVFLKLRDATQAWDAEAPLIFENLEDLDVSRIQRLQEKLDQYQTQESEQAARLLEIADETKNVVGRIDATAETHGFAARTTLGRPSLPTRTSTRLSSMATGRQTSFDQPPPMPSADTSNSNASALNPPPTRGSQSQHEDELGDQFSNDQLKESRLRRIGTLFTRRRQSVHGSLAPPNTRGPTFGRLGSSHGRGLSPRASSTNLHESGRLAPLAETPDTTALSHDGSAHEESRLHNGTNGAIVKENNGSSGVNGAKSTDIFAVPAPPGPPPTQQTEHSGEPAKDSEGFTARAPMNDPISEVQREAAGEEADQLFKLNIQNAPVEEEDPQAKEAALSSVANTLKQGPATRRTSTIRGRRDVRNTVYVPPPGAAAGFNESALPAISASPPMPAGAVFPRSPALQNLASEASVAGTSDTQSVRSGHSFGTLVHAKHPEMSGPGLQSSIIETVSAVFEDGAVKSASISGELAFVNNEADDVSSEKTHETIRINNFSSLERIGPNRIFVQNASLEQPDQFALDLSHLAKTAIAFSYKVFSEESDPPSLAKHALLSLKLAWKPQDDKLGLLLQYQRNPDSGFTGPVTLHKVVLVARYGGKAASAQTKPSGTHLKEKHLVYWRLGDVTLTDVPQKIVCRIVGADGVCPTAGHAEARWEYAASGGEVVGSGISVSRLADKGKGKDVVAGGEDDDDPFSDAESPAPASSQAWIDVPVSRKLVGGEYQGR